MTWQKAPGYSIQILRGTERTYLYENWTNHRQDRVGILHWETTEGFQVVHRKVAARLQVAPRTRTAAKTEIPYAFTFHWVTASDSNSPHGTGLNSPHLHRGHLPAVSNVTGLVKCFIYRQSLHFHRIEHSGDGPIWVNAFPAVSRIASSAAFSVFSLDSIGLSVSELASELNVSVKTIETHQMRMKDKLGLHSAAELRQKAHGWLARSAVNRIREEPELEQATERAFG
jgi:Bacterial regulatory proteins, luxR family